MTSSEGAAPDYPEWFVRERERFKRMHLWALGVTLVALLVTMLLLLARTKWAIAPLPIVVGGQIVEWYAIAKGVMLGRRARTAGISPRATPRQLIFVGVFGALCLAGGLYGLVAHDGAMIFYGFVGAGCFAVSGAQVVRAMRRS